MKKITLWLLTLFASWQMSAQSTCTQTFSASGYDYSGVNLTINAADLNCNGTGTISSIRTLNASGELTNSHCSTDQTSWYSFLVSIDGGAGTYICGTDFNDIDLTGFSSLSITAQDDDGWSDDITLNLDVEITYTAVEVPSCTSLSVPANGASSVMSSLVSWPSAAGTDGYKLTVGTVSGGVDVLNMFDVGNVLSYDLGALSGATTYYVTVTPYNVIGDATGCAESSFTTCGINTIPFFEGFETGYVDAEKVENCISQESIGGTDVWRANNSAVDYNREPRTGNWNSYLEYGNEDWLFIPIQLDGGTLYSVELYARQDGGNNANTNIAISYGTTPDATGMTETIVPVVGLVNGEYQRVSGTFTPASTGTYYVGIKGYLNYSPWYISLDDITIDLAPPCVDPNNLVASNITSDSVQLDWNDPSGNQFDFEYLILPTGSTAPDNTTSGVSIGDLTVTDSSLSPATTYDAYVRAYCSTSDQSMWVGPITFTTACVAVSEFSEDFEGVSAPDLPICWTSVLENASEYAFVKTYAYSSNSGSNSVYIYNSGSGSTANIILVSPVVDNLGAGTHRLKFFAYSYSSDVEIGTMTDPYDASTFTLFETVSLTSGFEQYVVNFDTYAGSDSYIAFRHPNESSYSDIYVDDAIWEANPTVVPSCATNVVSSVDNCGNFATAISWDAVSGAEGYKIVIGTTSGGNDVVDNQDLGVALNYSYEGALNTTYYFTVIPYNAVGDAVGCLEQTFTTSSNGCYCMPSSTSTSTYIDNFTTTSSSGTNISNVSSGYTTGGYADNSASMSVVAYSGLSFDFNAEIVGGTVGCSVWVDWDGNYSFDSTERVYNTTSYGDGPFTGAITVPSSVANGDYRMRVLIHYNSLNPSDPCASNARLEAEDYTLTVETGSCSPATIESNDIVADCANEQYSISFEITNLGDGTPSITDGTNSWPVTLGTVTVGPFTSGSEVSLTLLHGSDNTCDLSLGDFVYTCPPSNDECDNAIALTVNSDLNCGVVTAGTTVSATDSGIEPGIAVTGTPNNDVWFSFEATATSHQIALSNVVAVVGTATDMGMAVFSGSCSSFALVADSDPNSFTVSGLTIGDTYYVSVYGWASGTGTAQTNFNICVGTDPALSNSDFGIVDSFKAYPNPVKDILNLEYSSDITEIRVINVLGQEVLAQKANATSTQVNMTNLAAGTYIVNVQVGDTVKTLKVIKQ